MGKDMRQDVGMGLMGALVLVFGLLLASVDNEVLASFGQIAAALGGLTILLAIYTVARALMSGR